MQLRRFDDKGLDVIKPEKGPSQRRFVFQITAFQNQA